MQTKHAVAFGLALLISAPSIGRTQGGRDFENSWFWGVKAGALSYGAPNASGTTGGTATAALAGGEWLITRTQGGLYVSVAQAFLSQQTAITNGPTASDTGFRVVDMKNLRRVDIAGMIFPTAHGKFQPYVGLGFALTTVGSAAAEGPFSTAGQIDFANQTIQNGKAEITPLLIGGGQYKLKRFSAFGQLAFTTTNKDFLMYSGQGSSMSLELGIRFNLGPSKDTDK